MSKEKAKPGKLVTIPVSASGSAEQLEIARLRVKVLDLAKRLDEMNTPSLERIRDYYEPKLKKRGHKLMVPIPKFLDEFYEKWKAKKHGKAE